MAYDEALAERVRDALEELLDDPGEIREQRMFGGVCFMVRGNMCCGVNGGDLMARLSAEEGTAALNEPFARPMDFTGRPMKGWLWVGPAVDFDDDALSGWVSRCLDHCLTLKPK